MKHKQGPHFYWDVVFEEKVEISTREKMTKARARNMLNVSEDEKITQNTVYRAWLVMRVVIVAFVLDILS